MEPRVGVGAVIVNDRGEWLLMKRKCSPEAGLWSLPGGKVDWMETIEEAIVREVKEELGIWIKLHRLLGVTNHLLPEEQAHWVAPTFLATIDEGTPSIQEPEKHQSFIWLHPDEFANDITKTTKSALYFYRTIGNIK